jgi:methionyl-tRNA formyltransferase
MPGSALPAVLFFGYSDAGCRALELLIRRGVEVAAVVTHEDDPGERRWFASLAELAARHGIPTERPHELRAPGVLARLAHYRADLILSVYYRRLIPTELLATAPLGAFNVHGSLLPRYRGCAPVNWAIIHGETETGATLHHMTAVADAGDIVDQQAVAIAPEDTAREVMANVVDAAEVVLARQLDALLSASAPRRPQDDRRATRFRRRRPADGLIDWSAPASSVVNLVRAVAAPFPGAFTWAGGDQLFVWSARRVEGHGPPGLVLGDHPRVVAAGEGAVRLDEWSWGPGAQRVAFPASGSRLSAGTAQPGTARPPAWRQPPSNTAMQEHTWSRQG